MLPVLYVPPVAAWRCRNEKKICVQKDMEVQV